MRARPPGSTRCSASSLSGSTSSSPASPLFASVATSEGARIFLSEHAGDARPDTLLYVWVDDVDDTHRALREAGVDVPPPEAQPWGREISVRDPDGNRLRIATHAE